MSTPSHSPQNDEEQITHHEQTIPSDAVLEDYQSQLLNQEETPNQADPPEPVPDALPPPEAVHDPDNQEEEEEQEPEEEEEVPEQEISETPAIPSGMPLHVVLRVTDTHASSDPDVTLASPSRNPNPEPSRGANKRKKGKGKGKGKGKPNFKRQQTIDKKLTFLRENLNPIPFIPHKLLDFAKHEKLLRKLGLWDFVQIDFDRKLRVDLLAELIATYNSRCSYVGGYRIGVSRADLARAFGMPVKKEKGNTGGIEVDLDSEEVSEDSAAFLEGLVSDWMLLHEDTWITPNEVVNWLNTIKDGHPEKVDWASLLWFMVEKELAQGDKLVDFYYASHLQYLIRHQRPELWSHLDELFPTELVTLEMEEKEEEDEVNMGDGKVDGMEGCMMRGPSIELTLGQDGEEEDVKDAEKGIEHAAEEDGGEEEAGQWLLHGKNNLGGHFMQPCSAANGSGFGNFEHGKMEDEETEMEEDEEETGDGFTVFPNDDALEGDDGLTGNLLQTMEANQIAFSSPGQLHHSASLDIGNDVQHMASAPSFFNQVGKRVMDHDNDISNPTLNNSNKRLRINESWDPKPLNFEMCMENIQQMIERARMYHEEKEQTLEQSNMNQQIMLSELQKRDGVINHLHKTKVEEIQKKDAEIYRLERELYIMGGVLDGYRKALKETQKAFAEYREKAQLPEEPVYRDAGPGGVMLSIGEIERIRKKQEEEYHMNCLIVEQKMKEAAEGYDAQFEGFLAKVNLLDKKLAGLEAQAKELIALYAKRKVEETGANVQETGETVQEIGEKGQETGEKVHETGENVQETEEKVKETGENVQEIGENVQETEEKVKETGENIQETEEEGIEIAEPLPGE